MLQSNAEFIFGPDSIYLPKSLIHTSEKAGTVPDGFVVDIAARRWFVIEAELAIHSVWSHIAPQVAKQIIAASQPATRRMLAEVIVSRVTRVKENSAFREKFDNLAVDAIDIRQFVADILEQKPVIGIPIDDAGPDLREWAQTLKNEVRLWIVRKLVEFGNPSNVIYEIPEEYRPVFDSSPESDEPTQGYKSYDVSIADLIQGHLLTSGQTLTMTYKLKGGERKQYEAAVLPDGSLKTLNQEFSAPSYAALACIQAAGSSRETVNGWISWKDEAGQTLADLREKFLEQKKSSPGI